MPPTPRHRYSKDVKKLVIYQSNVLNMLTTDIVVNLDMPVRVVQRVLQTWDEIGAVVREPKTLGRAHLMTTEQAQVSLTPFCKVFRLMTTGGVGSDQAKTRNLFG